MLPLALAMAGCDRPGDPIPPLAPAAPRSCIGDWLGITDGVPRVRGREVFDALGRSVEDETHTLDPAGQDTHTWRVWETDAAGVDRLVEESSSADGGPEGVTTWAYELDDQLRLARMETLSNGSDPTRDETYTYDADGDLVATDSTDGGEPAGGGRYTWVDGRLVQTDSLGPGGGVVARDVRDYLEPAPSLDHVDTFSWNGTVAVTRLYYDALGQLLEEWTVDADGREALALTQTWDDDGHVIDAVQVWPMNGLWGDVPGETHTISTYRADGRILVERVESDEHADGTAEHVGETDWSWRCE